MSIIENNDAENHLRTIYIIGGIFTIIALIGFVLDVIIGSITGGNLSLYLRQQLKNLFNFNKIRYLGFIILIY